MTYTPTLFKSYQNYLDDEDCSPDKNYRLLSTGELVEVPPEDDDNIAVAYVLSLLLLKSSSQDLAQLIRTGTKELQVHPVGDKWVNRKPDLLILHPEHRKIAKQAVLLGMVPPLFVAEVVSPGKENSDNYRRDYVWKREQYQDWKIPEYWIIDRHRGKVTVLILEGDAYKEAVYSGRDKIVSTVFPEIEATAVQVLNAGL